MAGYAENLYLIRRLVVTVVVFGLVAACDRMIEHRPLTSAEFAAADFSQIVPERFWADGLPPNLEASIRASAPILRAQYPEAVDADPMTAPVRAMLVISGGGANGAFGAGVLSGWSETGSRPKFSVVSGVSTGAMIAPFAFLGPEYDKTLVDIYSSVGRDDVFLISTMSGVFGSSIADTAPLKKLIDTYVTQEIIDKIAEETRRERHLFVVTTQFDALRPVVWDIGAIALRRGKKALPLIRNIILASAAIPILFPPVAIEWESNGQRFTELHVDGGVTHQVFAYPTQIRANRINELLGLTFRRRIYLIQNGNARPRYQPAGVGTLDIAERSVKALLQNKENGDIERIYYLAKRDGVEFQMIEIPKAYQTDHSIGFNIDEMQKLLELGRDIGRRDDAWHDRPPAERGVN